MPSIAPRVPALTPASPRNPARFLARAVSPVVVYKNTQVCSSGTLTTSFSFPLPRCIGSYCEPANQANVGENTPHSFKSKKAKDRRAKPVSPSITPSPPLYLLPTPSILREFSHNFRTPPAPTPPPQHPSPTPSPLPRPAPLPPPASHPQFSPTPAVPPRQPTSTSPPPPTLPPPPLPLLTPRPPFPTSRHTPTSASRLVE